MPIGDFTTKSSYNLNMEKLNLNNNENTESKESGSVISNTHKIIEGAKDYIKKMSLTGIVSLVCTMGVFAEAKDKDKGNDLFKQSNLEFFNDRTGVRIFTENIFSERGKDDTYYKYKITNNNVEDKNYSNNEFHGKDISPNENKQADTLYLGDIEASTLSVSVVKNFQESKKTESFYNNFSMDIAFKEIDVPDNENTDKELKEETITGYGSSAKEALFSAIGDTPLLKCRVFGITDSYIESSSENGKYNEKVLFGSISMVESDNILRDAVVVIKKNGDKNKTGIDDFAYTATLSFKTSLE